LAKHPSRLDRQLFLGDHFRKQDEVELNVDQL
jgi:hypothetical protein